MAFTTPSLFPNEQPNDTTKYTHPKDPNLSELHRAMEYTPSGTPGVRVVSDPANTSAFGELYGIEITPTIQLLPVYGVDTQNYVSTTTNINSTITLMNSYVRLIAGPVVDGVPSISIFRSKKFLRYRAGQGAIARWNVAFSTPLAGTEQRAGLFSYEEAVQFGYNGTEFGILHIYNKRMRIEQFQITVAPTGTETITVRLNNVPYIVSVSGTTAQVAQQIASHTGYGGLFLVEAEGNYITFVYLNNGDADTNIFSITSPGTLTTVRTTVQSPVLGTTDRIVQSQWNVDKMDGSGPSGAVLDPTKFNVYQVSYSWLGSGKLDFFVVNPSTGTPVLVHQILWINRYRILNALSPSYSVGGAIFHFGSTDTLELLFGSIMAGIEGKAVNLAYPKATSANKSSLNSSGTIYHLMSLRNSNLNDSALNYVDIVVNTLSVSVQGNDPSVVHLYMDTPLATGIHQYTNLQDANSSISTVDGTFSPTATPMISFTLPPNNGNIIDLSQYAIILPAGSKICVGISSTSGISRAATSLVWLED